MLLIKLKGRQSYFGTYLASLVEADILYFIFINK
jgi:hypothetical protein